MIIVFLLLVLCSRRSTQDGEKRTYLVVFDKSSPSFIFYDTISKTQEIIDTTYPFDKIITLDIEEIDDDLYLYCTSEYTVGVWLLKKSKGAIVFEKEWDFGVRGLGNVIGFCKEPQLNHFYYMSNSGIYEYANDTSILRLTVDAGGQLKCDFNRRILYAQKAEGARNTAILSYLMDEDRVDFKQIWLSIADCFDINFKDSMMYAPERKRLVYANLTAIKGILTNKEAAVPIDEFVPLTNVRSISLKDDFIYFVNGTFSVYKLNLLTKEVTEFLTVDQRRRLGGVTAYDGKPPEYTTTETTTTMTTSTTATTPATISTKVTTRDVIYYDEPTSANPEMTIDDIVGLNLSTENWGDHEMLNFSIGPISDAMSMNIHSDVIVFCLILLNSMNSHPG